MRLTVLGKSPAYQDVGGSCSGYLVTDGRTKLLLDCGTGVFANLRKQIDYFDLDAVLISHLHADHFFDLIPFSHGLIYTARRMKAPLSSWPAVTTAADENRPRLFVPPGAKDVFNVITSTWGQERLIEQAFAVTEYEVGAEIEINTIKAKTCALPHYIPSNAVDLHSQHTNRRLTFTADQGPAQDLVNFAQNTDLLLIEATLPHPESNGFRGHLTPSEAGEHGQQAKAAKLILTHYSDELDPDWILAQAKQTFSGPIELAREGESYDV